MYNKPANQTSQTGSRLDQPSGRATEQEGFARVRFVLVETSHPGNVGSVARALKTMGFGTVPGSLVLVRPREPGVREHAEAVAMASGADDVLAGACLVDDVEQALAGTALAVAMTARQREFGPPRLLPRAAVAQGRLCLDAAAGASIAFVFGNERFGLPNEVVERCSAVTHIPANPAYASLNLAQAVQLVAYEMRLALLEGAPAPEAGIGYAGEPATAEQVEAMFGHLQSGLEAIGFLDPAHPRKLMSRLRRLLARTGLEREEVNILRGVAKHMLLAAQDDRGGRDDRPDGGTDGQAG
ncbi:RNA methyltransferase [Cupriavidus sp. USMAA2-4]|uniref:tRNA (cytidine/uridine-2'-O-)-methyltransferase TrmJ n=1 Tax=Cupriavidus malaysiensis TaxID=367825 RepID=A0A1D9I1M0_9BURK|nr:RNA methyltransferase [Cupriavidus sp. USMAA2-4]AOY99373.1 RNA methyltransferase [Cupriavidus sp. USMAHM13]AOZ05990.1 RNA methyltransferase [Cupriavidus malaysiensis]